MTSLKLAANSQRVDIFAYRCAEGRRIIGSEKVMSTNARKYFRIADK